MRVTRRGSLVGLTPASDGEREWIDLNIESEGWQWMGPTLWIDLRFAFDIVEDLTNQGFEVTS